MAYTGRSQSKFKLTQPQELGFDLSAVSAETYSETIVWVETTISKPSFRETMVHALQWSQNRLSAVALSKGALNYSFDFAKI